MAEDDYTDGGGYDYTDGGGSDYTDGGGYTYTDGGGYASEPTYVSGGTSYGGEYSYPTTYSYPTGSTVSSASFTGGTLYTATPTYSYPTNQTVYSGSFSGGTQYGYPYPNPVGYGYGSLNGSCSASFANSQTGMMVTWTGTASGGNGIYSYYWSGTNGLSGTGQYISETYPSVGVETADLTITSSDGQTVTRTCSATLGNQNQVLAYSATNPNLQSVYLSDVPYTGAGDVAKVLGFISVLLLWSTALAYFFLKRKERLENPMLASVVSDTDTKETQSFRMNIDSDSQAIESIETYARMNKVLLSSDAAVQLAKLARLNKIDPKDAIKKMSGDEWATIGKDDIQKYL